MNGTSLPAGQCSEKKRAQASLKGRSGRNSAVKRLMESSSGCTSCQGPCPNSGGCPLRSALSCTTFFGGSSPGSSPRPVKAPASVVCTRRSRSERSSGSWVRGRRDIRLPRSEEHTSELQSRFDLVCRLLLEKKYYHL